VRFRLGLIRDLDEDPSLPELSQWPVRNNNIVDVYIIIINMVFQDGSKAAFLFKFLRLNISCIQLCK